MATASSTTPWCGFDEFHIDLIKFFRDRAVQTVEPLKLRTLCREFMKDNCPHLTIPHLQHRAALVKNRIHELKEFDMETRIRMLFALGVPVDEYFADEIREQEDVILELDERNRITKYEKKGGIKLTGKQTHIGFRGFSEKDRNIQSRMMEHLAKRSTTVNAPLPVTAFLNDFKECTGEESLVGMMWKRYDVVKSNIFGATEYDLNTRIKMLFISGARLPDRVLKELQNIAFVNVDSENRIIGFCAYDGSLDLIGTHMHLGKKKSVFEESLNTEPEEDYYGYNDVSGNSNLVVPKREESEERRSQKRKPVELKSLGEPVPKKNHSMPGPSSVKKEVTEQERLENYMAGIDSTSPVRIKFVSTSSEPMDVIGSGEVLRILRNLLWSLCNPHLTNLLKTVEEALLHNAHEDIPTEALKCVLLSSIYLGQSHAAEIVPVDSLGPWKSYPYEQFLILYRFTVYSMDKNEQLEEVQQKITEFIGTAGNKKLETTRLKMMVENVLALVT
ncbi:hypothetical protein L5515_016490 [Caenorhabditis briggsae]|uniref:SPK domain-containing protein n=2 Tax=Caenorhabditis briggsae TaxID=6238 RepID=A0AAE9JQ68_CAEBR|nr:hypothetical protein L5515_016490 [Caenorhabditis briggsae]